MPEAATAITQETTTQTTEATTATETSQASTSNWRDAFGDDPKVRKTLERYTTQADVGKALLEAKARISAGDLLKPLPADAKPEDIEAYRNQLGIPNDPAGYLEKLPAELVADEDSKAVFTELATALHGTNARPEQVEAAAKWYAEHTTKQVEARQEADTQEAQLATDMLRDEWGSDYRANINIAQAFLQSSFSEDLRESLLNARMADGTALMNNVEFLKTLASMGRELNPMTQIIAAGHTDVKGLDEEMAQIESKMGTHAYYQDKKMQSRYTELLERKMAMEARQK